MPDDLYVGQTVQTPLGKGIVREIRRNGRLLVEIARRTVHFDRPAVTPIEAGRRPARPRVHPEASPARGPAPPAPVPIDIDLHGLTVDEALARVERGLDTALLADLAEIRIIHGRSGGRIRAAVHRWLRGVGSVRAFRLDPRNAGVTIVTL